MILSNTPFQSSHVKWIHFNQELATFIKGICCCMQEKEICRLEDYRYTVFWPHDLMKLSWHRKQITLYEMY